MAVTAGPDTNVVGFGHAIDVSEGVAELGSERLHATSTVGASPYPHVLHSPFAAQVALFFLLPGRWRDMLALFFSVFRSRPDN